MFAKRLLCPKCGAPAHAEIQFVLCSGCAQRYPIEDGVPRFLDGDGSDAYEHASISSFSRAQHSRFVADFYSRFLTEHYLTYIDEYIPSHGTVLDIGSSGGTGWLAGRHIAGLDRSLKGMQIAAHQYDIAVQADAAHIPFIEGTFDAVISRYFWEHIATADKPAVLHECYRVLKPEGVLIFLFDLDSQNPLFRWAKRFPLLYQKYFVDRLGHIGYQTASANLDMLSCNGFDVIAMRASSKTWLQNQAVYAWMDNEYCDYSALLRLAAGLRRIIVRSKTLLRIYQVMHAAVDDIVQPLLPLDYAFRLLVAARKR